MAHNEDWEDTVGNLLATLLLIALSIILAVWSGLFRYLAAAFGRHGLHPLLLGATALGVGAILFGLLLMMAASWTIAVWVLAGSLGGSLATFALADGLLTVRRLRRGEALLHEDLSETPLLETPWWHQ